MSKFFDEITEKLQQFIAEQKMFFISTAPKDGRINLSPKGLDTFRILDNKTVAYLDLTGSGNETAAHLAENGRATIMFCGFEKQPMILRLYCKGRTVSESQKEWEALAANFELLPGCRQIAVFEVESLQTSCGFGIPYYSYEGERKTLVDYSAKLGDEKVRAYWQEKNTTSIDGLPTPALP